MGRKTSEYRSIMRVTIDIIITLNKMFQRAISDVQLFCPFFNYRCFVTINLLIYSIKKTVIA